MWLVSEMCDFTNKQGQQMVNWDTGTTGNSVSFHYCPFLTWQLCFVFPTERKTVFCQEGTKCVMEIIITSKIGQIKKSLTAQFLCKRDHQDKISNAFSFLKLLLRSEASHDTVMILTQMLSERPFDTFKSITIFLCWLRSKIKTER